MNFLPFILGFNKYGPLFAIKTHLLLADHSDTLSTMTAVSLIPYHLINPQLLSVDVYQVQPSCGINKDRDCEESCGQVA